MKFRVVPNNLTPAPSEGNATGYLWTDRWDDWFKFSTLYYLTYFDRLGRKHELGGVKVGQFNWKEGQRRPDLPACFERLSDVFFSLGQDIDFYKGLMEVAEDERIALLKALKDVASNKELYSRALKEEVMRESLMRSTGRRKVEIQYRAVLDGGAELTPYKFSFRAPRTPNSLSDPVELAFEVTPGATPPTNIHVLIGRNGVGKTRLLRCMTRALVDPSTSKRRDGEFSFEETEFDFVARQHESFANLVSVTFSAFDDFISIEKAPDREKEKIGYTNVGLRKRIGKGDQQQIITQDIDRLSSDFAKSALKCSKGVRRKRWKRALETLETDSLFSEIDVANLADTESEENFDDQAKSLYKKLSSGHKIVLLTITKLVELVEERSLILMDEPEAHLHPPLLSAFVRSVSDLLTDRNGVAVIATHSPVVVQEVPTSCVWKISRHGLSSKAERLELETFAETVSVLTREVFGLEVDRSGFHRMLHQIVTEEESFEAVLQRLDQQVGGQGQALIQAMLARSSHQGSD